MVKNTLENTLDSLRLFSFGSDGTHTFHYGKRSRVLRLDIRSNEDIVNFDVNLIYNSKSKKVRNVLRGLKISREFLYVMSSPTVNEHLSKKDFNEVVFLLHKYARESVPMMLSEILIDKFKHGKLEVKEESVSIHDKELRMNIDYNKYNEEFYISFFLDEEPIFTFNNPEELATKIPVFRVFIDIFDCGYDVYANHDYVSKKNNLRHYCSNDMFIINPKIDVSNRELIDLLKKILEII